MKTYLQITCLLLITSASFAQNKTLGVGVPTPNSNAALHVESPGNNQGFIMPRLTTAQRTAMSGLLAGADNGLMLYDSDVKSIFFWTGAAWMSSAQAAGLTLPIASAANTSLTAIDITNAGSGSAGNFTINNATSSAAALTVGTNGTGNAITANGKVQASQFVGDGSLLTGTPGGLTLPFTGSSSASANTFDISNDGASGSAAVFNISNAANGQSTIYANNDGTGATLLAETSTGYTTIQTNNGGSGVAIQANASGTSSAGTFGISNALNGQPAVYMNTIGTGASLVAETSTGYTAIDAKGHGVSQGISVLSDGTNNAAEFQINNATNPSSVVHVATNGLGQSGHFEINNVSNGQPALYAITTGTGRASNFVINNATSAEAAIVTETFGVGAAAAFFVNNALSAAPGSVSETNGIGSAAEFNVSDPSNSAPALNINHAGTGNAITANRPIQATSFIGDGSTLTNVIPSGIIMPFAGASSPTGYLLCDGSAVSRTTYANLFAAIGTSWGVGDGSTTFNLPDLRGRFLRGVDGGAGNDPDAATRTAFNGGASGNIVGSLQADDFASHTHGGVGNGFFTNAGSSPNLQNGAGNAYLVSPNTLAAGGNETRPKNAYVNYIVKF